VCTLGREGQAVMPATLTIVITLTPMLHMLHDSGRMLTLTLNLTLTLTLQPASPRSRRRACSSACSAGRRRRATPRRRTSPRLATGSPSSKSPSASSGTHPMERHLVMTVLIGVYGNRRKPSSLVWVCTPNRVTHG